MNQSVTFTFNELGGLEFIFTYGEMTMISIDHCPYMSDDETRNQYINDLGKEEKFCLRVVDDGYDHEIKITLPQSFIPLYIDALKEAMKDRRMSFETRLIL